MNRKNLTGVLTGCLAIGLFVLTSFQNVRADDVVAATASVTSPSNGQIFYLGAGNDTMSVSGSATYDAQYLNTDPDGTPTRMVYISVTFTFKHATAGGYWPTAHVAFGNFTLAPQTGKEFTDSQSGSSTFYENTYVTEATTNISAGLATATYPADNNWSIVGGAAPGGLEGAVKPKRFPPRSRVARGPLNLASRFNW